MRRRRLVLGVDTICTDALSVLDDYTLARQFSLESQLRAIDACDDIDELRHLAKSLLSAWQMQRDMTRLYGAQALDLSREQLLGMVSPQ